MRDHEDLLQLRFHGDLKELLSRGGSRQDCVRYPLTRRASIKDIIESLGIPHTEIGRIRAEHGDVGFSFIPQDGNRLDILPIKEESLPSRSTVLRPDPIGSYRFLVDINAARLTSLLRMAGFDAAAVLELPLLDSKRAIAAAARRQNRILLSRDRELLKLRTVVHGRLIRNQQPYRQLQEIVNLYRLQPLMEPFSLCMKCNRPLEPVAKETILSRLEPLTKKYYSVFSQCSRCKNIYWQGSHYERMLEILKISEVPP